MKIRSRVQGFFVPQSLRFQLLSRSMIFMSVVLLVIGLFQFLLMRQFLYQNKAGAIQSQIMALPPDVWEQVMLGSSRSDGEKHFPFLVSPDARIAYVDRDGNFSVLSNSSEDSVPPPALAADEYQTVIRTKHHLNYRVVRDEAGNEQLVVLQAIETRSHRSGVVQVSVRTKPLQDDLMRQLLTFLALSLFALVGGLLAFIPVLKKTLVPLSNMVDKVGQIDAGNLAERFPAQQGQVEIDRLAGSFNGMFERLETSFAAEKEAKEQMRRFVADASHELRTPLTSIHGFLEVLLRGAVHQPDKLDKSIKSMYAESTRMKKLVQDLLLLAKLDRSPNIELIPGDLSEMIVGMEPQLKLLAGDRGLKFNLVTEAHCLFDPDKIKQVILNLFHNAVQHTDPVKGEIGLSVTIAARKIELAIGDNGTGISAEHLQHLFDRFYRIDSSRTRKNGGAGLGLSISKSIVELHGGTIWVESRVGGGSTFYVRLPKPETNGCSHLER